MKREMPLIILVLAALGAIAAFGPTPSNAADTASFVPEADAYVSAGSPTRNYGVSTTLLADASPQLESFVRFSVPPLNGRVTSAKLRAYAFNATVDGPAVYAANASWTERSVTWATKPARIGAVITDIGHVAKNTWIEWDVTSAISSGGTYSFAIVSTSKDGVDLYSREGLNPLRLVVTSEAAAPPPPAPGPTQPTVAISSPLSGVTYTAPQSVQVIANVSGTTDVQRVEFFRNGALVGSEDTAPFAYSWNIASAVNGVHSWSARVVDSAGQSATSNAVIVTVAIPVASGAPPTFAQVAAREETDPVLSSGDAADDPAIWVHPTDPALSLVIGTNKLGGLAAYDLSGTQLQYVSGIQPNNVDIRYAFPLAGAPSAIVVASERTSDSLAVFRVNPATRLLESVSARTISVGMGVSGLCMYRSTSGRYYVFVGDSSGTVQQWELFESTAGRVDGRRVRTITLGSTTEGCVADDESGSLYLAEEDVAIWRYGADPSAGTARTKVDGVGEGRLTPDIEGLALYAPSGGRGYLLASNQGTNSFVVYRRDASNEYVGTFGVPAGAFDGVTYTDGIDVTSAGLGSRFPDGLFVAQDDRNDSGNQNFKLVSWGEIARAMGLLIDTGGSALPPPPPPPPPPLPPPPPPPPPAVGARYFVDAVAGNDQNSGMSETSAWRTLTKATSALLAPGDQLLLRRDGTWSGTLTIAESGAVGNPIVVDAYGTGTLPRITGASNCVRLEGSQLVVRELHTDNCSWSGFYISGNDNRVDDSLATRNAAGVYVREGALRNAIVGNTIRDNNQMSVLTTTAGDDSGAFGVLIRGDSTEVAYNTISGSDAFSYDYGRDGAAVEIYGGRNNHIHHNIALDNDAFTELGGSRAADNVFAYNSVRSSLNESTFLVTRGSSSSYGPIARTSVLNNTVVLTGAESEGVVCHGGCTSEILFMRNNIVSAVKQSGYADGPFDEEHNLFWGGPVRWVLGPNSRFADPQFLDPAAGNLRLRGSSPAIDRGAVLSQYSLDLDRLAVPVDGNADGNLDRDLGAYEYRR